MPLHIDYRPETLDEVIGNNGIKKKLKTIFGRESKDYPHSYLFSGFSGCGKTTFSRIIKDLVGCEEEDFIEMGPPYGVNDAKEIIRTMNFLPSGNSRIYLIDEFHRCSKDFQDAMLKPMEDAPNHVYFIISTNEPQKVIFPIKRRCSSFEVEKLSIKHLEELINKILDDEGIDDIPDTAIAKIANESDGCPGMALVILDQVIDLSPDEIEDAIKNLSISEDPEVIDLCRALSKKAEWKDVTRILKGLKKDPEGIRQAIIGYARSCILNSADLDDTAHFALMYECFREPNYANGTAGLAFACLEVIEG